MQHQSLRIEQSSPLRLHYESVAHETLSILWRRRLLILLPLLVALAGAVAAIILLDERYTADALLRIDLAQADRNRPAATGPGINLEPGALIETEARVLRSRAMALRVVQRLGLENDPAFAVREPRIVQAVAWLRSAFAISDPERQPTASPAASLIAVTLMRNLHIASEPRVYVISIAYTASSPVQAATIANAFADEYLRYRGEAAASRALGEISATYGPRHPAVLNARAHLGAGAGGDPGASIVMAAQPIPIPSGPNRILILVFSAAGALALGIITALLLERRDTGLRSIAEVSSETGLRCLGMVPEIRAKPRPQELTVFIEGVRGVLAAASLAVPSAKRRVVLVASSVPGEGKSWLAITLAQTLATAGIRTLVIDATPRFTDDPSKVTSPSLEEVLDGNDGLFHAERDESGGATRFVLLRRTSGLHESQQVLATPAFERLLARARDSFGVVLIEAPPVMLAPDALNLARMCDGVIYAVRWHQTPRSTVRAALERLSDAGIRVDGIVLSRVDRARHRRFHTVDGYYYLDRHPELFRAPESPATTPDGSPAASG